MSHLKSPLSWAAIRPWKTAFTAGNSLFVECEKLRKAGLEQGAIIEGLYLTAYDKAAAGGDACSEWYFFSSLRDFGTEGLKSLPREGASTREPDWSEMFDMKRDGNEAYRAIRMLCAELRSTGFDEKDIVSGLLQCTGDQLATCAEEAQRYWFRQFETEGSRAAAIAWEEISSKSVSAVD